MPISRRLIAGDERLKHILSQFKTVYWAIVSTSTIATISLCAGAGYRGKTLCVLTHTHLGQHIQHTHSIFTKKQ